MSIISKSVTGISERKSGGLRVRLEYVFSDGRNITLGPISVESMDDANSQLSNREAAVLQTIQELDAEEAVSLSITTAHKEATQGNVYYAWLDAGWSAEDSAEAYATLSQVAEEVLSLGLTPEQMAVAFGSTVEDANAVLDRWYYLDANKEAIVAYNLVSEGDT